ncbi:LOW QUALITY PROTEIN: hypothetical protein HZS_6413 [Henneguya salminicola]|nr:LOW QUALITY PROTEIN: hypothetical protein HZS_6413 [Henneguya salminicola]
MSLILKADHYSSTISNYFKHFTKLIFRSFEIEDIWVERSKDRRVSDRTISTLLSAILNHIRPKSRITTDCFSRDYSSQDSYTYLAVNHSWEFIPIGACTNTIDSIQGDIKTRIEAINQTYLYDETTNKITTRLIIFLGNFSEGKRISNRCYKNIK